MRRSKRALLDLVERTIQYPEDTKLEAHDIELLGQLARRLETLQDQIKDLRKHKKSISAGFRDVTDNRQERTRLEEAMRRVSQTLSRSEAAARSLQKELTDILDSCDKEETSPQVPAHLLRAAPVGNAPDDIVFVSLSESNRTRWDDFVASQERASLYHDSRWRKVVVEAMGQKCLSLIALDGSEEILGVLPLFQLKSRLFGNFAVSVPYVNYGGALGVNAGIERALMREAATRARASGIAHIEFRETQPREGWPSRKNKYSMIRPLPTTAEELAGELGSKVRAQIRRARRERIKIRVGRSPDLLNRFYDVFARNMRDLGTPVYSRQLFARILSLWPDDATILVLELDGQPVGAAILLRHRDTLEIPWASTIREFNHLGINMLMYWEALSIAIRDGCRFFDFGRSTRDSGTYRFKQQWQSVPVQHNWHYFLADDKALPQINPENPKYRFAIALWRGLPLRVTRWLGPHIVRNIP